MGRGSVSGALVCIACVLAGILAGIFGTNLLHLILTAAVLVFIGATWLIYRKRGFEAMLIFVAIFLGLCILVPMWSIIAYTSIPPNWMAAIWRALIR